MSGELARTRIHHLLADAAARTPDAPAVRDATGRWTYADLAAAARGTAEALADRGVEPGARVVTCAPPSRELVALLYATSVLGAVFVPLHPDTRPGQLDTVVGETDAAVVLSGTELRALADERREGTRERLRVRETDVPPDSGIALLLYTSGSTARPKGIVCPHDSVLFAVRAIAEALSYRSDDVVFCRLPLSFDYGLYQILLSARAGAELVLAQDVPVVRIVRAVRSSRATVVPLVPSLADALLNLLARNENGLPTVRLFTNTGESLSPAVAKMLERACPDAELFRMYGLSECKRVSILAPGEAVGRPESVGRPLPGTQVAILSPGGEELGPRALGRITVRGPHVMAGYWRSPELTARVFPIHPGTGERYLDTGDLGFVDEEGFLYFTGREDGVFKRRGVRMSIIEIEAAAVSLPGVRGAVALPPEPGRDLMLVVTGTLSSSEVIEGLAALIEPAKVPALCRTVDRLPLTANGKPDRRALARLAREEAGAVESERISGRISERINE
ncbi:class I adenylate-forming enzyme family protein [Streptomyces anulatus]